MATKGRVQAIKQMVANDKKVTVSSLNGTFRVVGETIHRDFEKLEGEGFLIGTYGGAVSNTAMLAGNIHFYKCAPSFHEERQPIARRAPPLIDNKITIAADSSSAVMELFRLLQDHSNLTSLTNSAGAIHVLAQSEAKVVSIGGELSRNTLSLQGRITKEIISRYHVDIVVMSCEDLDINSGALDFSEAEAEVKKTMIRQATEVALLVGHSKLDRRASVQLADSSHINYIITDKSLGVEWIALCRDNNIQLAW